MKALTQWVVDRPKTVIGTWLMVLAAAALLSAQLDRAIRGSTDGIPGSPSDEVMQDLRRAFGPDSAFVFPVVVESVRASVSEPEFVLTIERLEHGLTRSGNARNVRHFWNTGAHHLLGADQRSALVLVTPRAATFYEAEMMVGQIRDDIRSAELGSGFAAKVTGPVAVFHDTNRHSAHDLLAAERIGIPITLVILLLVLGAPLAAGLPLLLAFTAVLASLAALFVLSYWIPVSVFARNAVTMIGLGVGVDYALFLLARFRDELAAGRSVRDAVLNATQRTGGAVAFSGLTVAAGFLALLLVRVPLMHSLALGGAVVVAAAVAATLTLLPAAITLAGEKAYWPFGPGYAHKRRARFAGFWTAWPRLVMRYPWLALVPALAVLAIFIAPVFQISPWNPGAKDLPPAAEARQGAEVLRKNFSAGWLGPVVLAVDGGSRSLLEPARQQTLAALAERLARHPGISFLTDAQLAASGTMASIVLIPREAPESAQSMTLVRELRREAWAEARAVGLTVRVAGASASIADFDEELFGSLWRVVPAVLAVTFFMLAVMFRSLLIPLKATLLNLASVLAAWGFLVIVFQHGVGAQWIGLEPPGGLNAFIVMMLFTILFGLSMDYEVFLLSRIKEERDRGADNATAVARGLRRTGASITSAALIMVVIFGSFAFTNLTATRAFGLGLAFAVALDATLVRLVLVPASMRLLGEWNWWVPCMGRANDERSIERSADRQPADGA